MVNLMASVKIATDRPPITIAAKTEKFRTNLTTIPVPWQIGQKFLCLGGGWQIL